MTNRVKKISYTGLLYLLSLFSVAVLAEGRTHIELAIKAEKIAVVTDDHGNKTIKKSEPLLMVPGDEVLYTITYTNISKDVATDVVITNPIPEHTHYVNNSVEGANSKVEFSLDGKQFDVPEKLRVITADGKSRPASAEDYTHVRWTVAERVAPGKKGVVSYRAVIE